MHKYSVIFIRIVSFRLWYPVKSISGPDLMLRRGGYSGSAKRNALICAVSTPNGLGGKQLKVTTLMMCSLERTHDFDPNPAIVNPIPIPAKWNH